MCVNTLPSLCVAVHWAVVCPRYNTVQAAPHTHCSVPASMFGVVVSCCCGSSAGVVGARSKWRALHCCSCSWWSVCCFGIAVRSSQAPWRCVCSCTAGFVILPHECSGVFPWLLCWLCCCSRVVVGHCVHVSVCDQAVRVLSGLRFSWIAATMLHPCAHTATATAPTGKQARTAPS